MIYASFPTAGTVVSAHYLRQDYLYNNIYGTNYD